MNLGEIRRRVYVRLAEDSASPLDFTDAEINRLINDSLAEMARNTAALEAVSFISVTASTAIYGLPTGKYGPFAVWYDSRRLDHRSNFWLARLGLDWRTHIGTPRYWMTNDQDDASLRLYPAPSASTPVARPSDIVGPGLLEIWSRDTPTILSSDSDVPALPGFTHLGLVYLATAKAFSKVSRRTNATLASFYRSLGREYQGFLAKIIATRSPQRMVIKGRINRPRLTRREVWQEQSIPAP